ncbi:outer membrane protein assembly factor BamA [Buchnera aphidicola (Melanaphis sacchari)]|uniref:Outer membrane protein assembly factor BamA n=1 Tax=Buchnera aphidicola (Melanaphis sacchari) TaxID=2173854 RepID=A0A2U8DGY8_9GAMM|nr:outer membrane protein assembly factor BamA [Buchnera aphidicola]AWH90542.1 outer membrane protein assembly factor BamA [Buchnera aphidicola (Melanaphis sacchari)]
MLIKKCFIIFLMLFSISAFAKNKWIVENIQLEGLKNISRDEILKNISFKIGCQISKDDITDNIKLLFKMGRFEDIRIFYSNKTIIFKIKEKPIISKVTIIGNNIIKDDVFKKYLSQLGIKSGLSFSYFKKNIFIKNIKNFYRLLGRYKTHIKIFTTFLPNNTVHLKILVHENDLSFINKIKITGNKKFSREKLISLFKFTQKSSFWNMLEKHVYYENQFEQDLNNLNNFYLNHGYYFCDISKKILNFSKNKVNILINIFEGDKYKISDIFINGNLFQYYKDIKDIVDIHYNDVYNKEKILAIKENIQKFLLEKGYINGYINVHPEIDFDRKEIALNFDINLKKRFFVNKIYFKGNNITKDFVLRRELRQIEGTWFNSKLVELSKEALENIKYLSDITVEKNILLDKDNAVDLIYRVKEKPAGSINFGIGHGKDSGLSLNASISQDNLWGSGDSLKASIIKNSNQKYAEISLVHPYFMDNNINLNARVFFNDFKYNLNMISTLFKSNFGFENNLGFLLNNFNRVAIGFGYTHNSLINKNIEKKFKKEEIINLNINNLSADNFLKNSTVDDFTINYSWMYNTLKYFNFPISGNQTYISGKNTIPGSDNNFYKILFDTEQYIPLNKEKSIIFFSHFHAGIGNGFREEKLPFYENFHTDSLNNIRGFKTNTLGPKKNYSNIDLQRCIEQKNSNLCESTESIGGNSMFISNIELIVPIPFINKEYSKFFRSSFFLDSGNVWDINWSKIKNFNFLQFSNLNILKNIYGSIGVSLQWFSPIGPLVFSYSHPIYKDSSNQFEKFQFNIGRSW